MNFKLIAGLSLSIFSLSVSNVLSAEKLDIDIRKSNNIYKVCDTDILNHHFVFCLLPAGCEEETTKTINVEVNTGESLTQQNMINVHEISLTKLKNTLDELFNLFGDKRLSEDGIHWTKTFITLLKYCAAHNEPLWIPSMVQMVFHSCGSVSLDKIAETIEKNPKLEPKLLHHKILRLMPSEIVNYKFIGADNKISFN